MSDYCPVATWELRYDTHFVTHIKCTTVYQWLNSRVRIYIPRHPALSCKVVPVLPLTEHHAMKAYWGSGDVAPTILGPRH
jgi:hypothetical protein